MRLKEIRMQKGLSQKAVSEKLECAPTVYSRYETGDREPSIDMLLKLAAFFGVTVDYLLGNEEITASALSSYELDLVAASREADERAREDALGMLRSHRVEKKKESLA